MNAAREWLCMWISIAWLKTHVSMPTVAKAQLTITLVYIHAATCRVAVGVAQHCKAQRHLPRSIVGYGNVAVNIQQD